MNAVGNDNYRAGLEPPEPMKHNTGWLSGNMAQLMVFLNGLILTITAFATLSVFIDETVKEGLQRITEDVYAHVSLGYNEAEKRLHALSSVIDMSDDIQDKKLFDYVSKKISGAGNFDQIYWVKNANISRSDHPDAEIIPLLDSINKTYSFNLKNNFINFIEQKADDRSQDVYAGLNLPGPSQVEYYDSPGTMGRSFAIIIPLKGSKNSANYLVGITNVNHFITAEWLLKKNAVYGLELVDAENDFSIYHFQNSTQNARLSSSSQYMNVVSMDFSGQKVESEIHLVVPPREAFLQKIPLLMLLFGITLTLIGTLYVRNNQAQSQKLAKMNKELAHKNFELNQEVSERERLNLVIQKSARENRSVINSVSDIIFEASVDGKLVFLNEAWRKVTGFELERSIGRNLFDLLYVQDQEEQRYNFEQLVKGQKKSYRTFTRLRSADGSFRAVELAISMMRQDENKELRVVGTITDVEERRRAERALSEAEKKYRNIVENAAAGIYQVTPEGQYLSANPAFAKILGFDAPEEILRDINNANEQLYTNTPSRTKFLRDVSVLKSSENFESQITKKNGDVIWVSENVRVVKDDEGNLLYFEGSMEDVDQRKKAEIALIQAKSESDLANRAKSEFLTNMSHELRTPLNSVIGFSEIIKDEAFGPLPQKEYKDYAKDIHESGKNLLNVINEILDVSRIEAGERMLNEGVVNIKEVIESCLKLMEGKIKTNKIRIENKIKNSTLGLVGETHAVKQMILNLMSNAVKFSPPNSLMMLDAEIDRKGRLRLSVTDTGIGLSEDEVEKALSSFGQIEVEHKRSKSGTGLGLTLVQSLVGLHGGELELVSQKGIGTTVTLIFPAKRVTSDRKAEKKEQEDNKKEDNKKEDNKKDDKKKEDVKDV